MALKSVSIAICDDEQDICSELTEYIEKAMKELNVRCNIDDHVTNRKLFEEMDSGKVYDLIFLDIQFKDEDMNGVEVATQIREVRKNYAVEIIFISWETKYIAELFDVMPMNFLNKPISEERMKKVIKKYVELSKLRHSSFTFRKSHTDYSLYYKDIMYIESRGNLLYVHLTDCREIEFYGSLKREYEEQLKRHDFLYISVNFAVNFDFIVGISRKEVHLKGMSSAIKISPDRQTEIKSKYADILERRSR